MGESKGGYEFPEHNEAVRDTWTENARFWDELMGDDGNTFHQHLVGPSQERLLMLKGGESVLEIACGNGQFTRKMLELGATVLATDLSEGMIEVARDRTRDHLDRVEFAVLDAADPKQLAALMRGGVDAGEAKWEAGHHSRGLDRADSTNAIAQGRIPFDAAVCTMALFDMASIDPLFTTLPTLLKPGGRFVFSILHPCFNSPPDLTMVAEKDFEGGIKTRYAIKLSRYIDPAAYENVAAPGQPALTRVFHRPLSMILGAGFRAGMVLDGLEEPVFGPEVPTRGTVAFDDIRDIPPVLTARMRPVG